MSVPSYIADDSFIFRVSFPLMDHKVPNKQQCEPQKHVSGRKMPKGYHMSNISSG